VRTGKTSCVKILIPAVYLRPRLTNQRINITTITTITIAVTNPALKTPPINSQEESIVIKTKALSQRDEDFFIIIFE
jgi:hypothetical protein